MGKDRRRKKGKKKRDKHGSKREQRPPMEPSVTDPQLTMDDLDADPHAVSRGARDVDAPHDDTLNEGAPMEPENEVAPPAAEVMASDPSSETEAIGTPVGELPPDASGQSMEADQDPAPAAVSRETSAKTEPETPYPAPFERRILVVANQKGGVGKTTTAVNLAAALALGGLDVLVVDLDPQGNASTALGVEHRQGTPGTYDVLLNGVPMEDCVKVSPESERLRVLPATIDLAGAEIELVSTVARESRLSRALTTYLGHHPAHFVLLDCPPSLGLLTLNALVAATEILVPIQCEYYALEGVSQLVRTIDLVKGELNESLQLGTVLLTMYDGRTRLAAQVADEVRAHFAAETLTTVIPRSVRISEAPSYGQTVLSYDPDSAGARSYRAAAEEIARRSRTVETR